MATKIVTKNSSTASAVPTASDLVQGELAVNVADKRLFTEDNGGSIVELGTNPSTIDINAGSIDGTAIGASSASTGAFTTLTASGLTVNNTTAFSYLPVSTAGSVVGTIGTGSGTIFNTPSVNASYGSGLAIDGSYSSDVSTINLKAFGPKFSSYSSQLAFHTSSGTSLTERMRIDSSGNVGVGTTSPSRVLSAKSSSVTVANFESTSGTAGFVSFSDSNTTNDVTVRAGAVGDNLALQAGGAERMRIDSSGHVGIGKTPLGNNLSPTLEMVSGGTMFGYGDAMYLTGNLYYNGGWKAIATGAGASMVLDASGPKFYTNASASAGGAVTPTERMRIDSSGNVGIGTSSPTGKLDVTVSTDARLYVSDNISEVGSGNFAFQVTNSAGSALKPMGFRAEDIRFATGSTERARLTSDGNLLVGKTAINFTTVGAELRSNGQINSGSTADFLNMFSTSASAYRFYVTNAGTIKATSTTISAISDQRFKENIRDLDDGLSKVMQLQPRKFDWKEGKGKNITNDRGFIAQEFEQVFPDLVDEWKDEAPEGEEPYKAVSADLIPTLVKAIQEQQTLIESLTARIAALEE